MSDNNKHNTKKFDERKKVLKENEGLVISKAKRFYKNFDELQQQGFIAAGNVGLIKALKRYKSECATAKFSTYAYNDIIGEMSKYYKKLKPELYTENIDERKKVLENSQDLNKQILISDVLLEIESLDPINRDIIKMKFGLEPFDGKEMTFRDISTELNTSEKEVKIIYNESVEMLQSFSSNELKEESYKKDYQGKKKTIITDRAQEELDDYDKNKGLIKCSKIFFQYFPTKTFEIMSIIEKGEETTIDFMSCVPVAEFTNLGGGRGRVKPLKPISDESLKSKIITFINHIEQFKFGKKNKGRMFWKDLLVVDEFWIDDFNMKKFVKYHASELMKYEMKTFLRALGVKKNTIRMYVADKSIVFKTDPKRAMLDRFDEYIDKTSKYSIKYEDLKRELDITIDDLEKMEQEGLIKYPYDLNNESEELVRLR